jgi:putative ABC transport system permease protein
MFLNYLKVIIRNFRSDKIYTFIIIFGLATGLASVLLIGQYIYFEMTFDQNVKDRERIYYTYLNWKTTEKEVDGKCFPAVAPFLSESLLEVESSVRIADIRFDYGNTVVLRREENGKLFFYSQTENLFWADPEVLDFFSVRMLSGDANHALKEPNTMIITRSLAEKFFPNEDPINKILTCQAGTFKIDSRITGITEDPAYNSSLQFNALFSTETIKQAWKDVDQSYVYPQFQTFTKLHVNADHKKVEQKLNDAAEQVRLLADKLKVTITIRMYPFEDFHFFRHHNGTSLEGVRFSGDKKLIFYLGVIAAFITLISFANYVNLTTARALRRAKEVGLRKVNGASRANLIIQFLIEFAFLNFIAFLLALTMAQFLFPVFAHTFGSRASWMIWTMPSFWLLALMVFVFCTAVSGIYPALVLSNYKPSKVLKGSFISSQSGLSVRRALVIVQFGLSVIMIMSIYIIAQQLFFLQDEELGISVDQVLVIRTNDLDVTLKRDAAYELLKTKIENLNHIINTSSASNFPGGDVARGFAFQLESDAEKKAQGFLVNQVSTNYFSTMGRGPNRRFGPCCHQ